MPRSFSMWTGLALSTLFTISACSTVPKETSLLEGINTKSLNASAKGAPVRSSSDPICSAFYNNVIEAAVKAEKAKRTNKQLASTGVSLLSVIAGVGPAGSIAANSATRIALSQSGANVSKTVFDPEQSFDKRVIDTARQVNCPITVKAAKAP